AEPALQAVRLLERGLHPPGRAAVAQAFDGGERVAVGLHREHRARLHWRAVDQHGARAAAGRVTTHVRAGEPDARADEVGEQYAGLDVAGVVGAVHRDRDLHDAAPP